MQQKWRKAINIAVALTLAVMAFPLFQPATPVVYAHPAVPVIEGYTEQWDTTGSTTLTFSKPSGVQVDELLLIIAINDDTSTTAFTDNKSGWNFIADFGNRTSDSHVGLFWRIADGTEGSSETVTSAGADEWGGWYARISGVNTTSPINQVGSATTASGSSITATAVTTDVDDCLALCFGSFDGGDGNNSAPFSVSGTGWSYEDDGSSGTSGDSDCSGVWGKKSMSGQGSTGDATISSDGTSDGMVGAQIAIAPPAAPTLDQNHYRWRNDQYGLNGNDGWYTDEDTAYTSLHKSTTVRLRAEIANTGGTTADNYQYRIEYATSVGGPWTAVPVTATTEPFEMVDSAKYTDGDNITSNFLTATGIWANGKGVEDSSNQTASFSLTNAYYTEFEYAIQATTDATAGGTYYFRLTNAGSPLDNYALYPEVTIYFAPDVDQIHYRWRNDDGGETDWGYQKTITFTSDTGKIPSTQSNFPVLIDVTDPDLRTTGNGGHVQNANGWDIVFTDSDGTTLLDHEIEKYTSSGSTATYTAWVKVPSLSTGKVIYMYYGNSGVASDPSTTDTWETNFKMVQHLDETSGTHDDSTTNNNDGTAQEGVTQDAAGKINGADDFDGVDNYIDCGNALSLDITSEVTLEAWVKKATPVKKNVAEFEPTQGVLIRYSGSSFGIPYTLIADMSDDVQIVTIVANTTDRNEVIQHYINNGVNCTGGNCTYLIAPSNSHWTRDYGPMFIWDETEEYEIVDFTYNRPRYDDNDIPGEYGSWQGIPVNLMDLEHTGGNYYCDGHGIAISTDLIEDENPGKTPAQIDAEVLNYLGITTYHKVSDAGATGIHHIDCWAKLLAPDKIMIKKGSTALNTAADWWANTPTTPYGGNYTVYRCEDGPYINCFIMNEYVYLPFQGNATDATVKGQFEAAMPGYTVRGYTDSWANDDALHCRVHEIAQSTPWDFDYIVSKGQDAYELQMNRVSSTVYGYTSDNEINTSTSTPTNWHHYVLTFDGSDQKLYIDGVLQNTTSPGGTIGSNSTEVTIGGAKPDPTDNFWGTLTDGGYFSGTLDEVRISATPRTADWIKTSYYSQNDPSANNFYTAGSETTGPTGATWKAAQDTVVTGQARVENLRVRFSIKNTGGTASDYYYRLQISETGPESGFSDVPTNTAGPGCDVAAMVTSTNFTNQDPTTNQLSADSLVWTTGKMVMDPSNQTDAITLNKDYFTEVEFNFRFTSNAAGETIYWFRVANGTTVSYTEVAQITIETIPLWDSYEGDYGDSGGTQCDAFFDYDTQHEVYMSGTGFSTGYYKVVYWDEVGTEIEVDANIEVTGDGNLYSICVFEKGKATEGDWHVTVYYPSSYEPAAYSTVDSNIVADDISYTTACGYAFYVDQGAIPEFPTVIAAISVACLCFGIYYWMRKRRLAHVKA